VETGSEHGGDLALEDQTDVFREIGELAQSRADPTRQLCEQGSANAVVGNRESGKNPQHQIGRHRDQVGGKLGCGGIKPEDLGGRSGPTSPDDGDPTGQTVESSGTRNAAKSSTASSPVGGGRLGERMEVASTVRFQVACGRPKSLTEPVVSKAADINSP